MSPFLNVRIVEITVPLLAAVVAWFVNEWRKRAWEEYQRKETSYRALMAASRGFHANAQDTQRKAAFLEQVDLCWLYCPDHVIRRAHETGDTSTAIRALSTPCNRTV